MCLGISLVMKDYHMGCLHQLGTKRVYFSPSVQLALFLTNVVKCQPPGSEQASCCWNMSHMTYIVGWSIAMWGQ